MEQATNFFKDLYNKTQDINVAKIGKVVNFNAEKMTADIMPMPSEDSSIILNVPVATIKTSDYIVYYPLKVNDIVVILFIDNDTDNILLGEDNTETERKHDISDCICIGGINLISSGVDVEEKDSLVIKSKACKVVVSNSDIKVDAPKIELKGYASYNGREIAVKGDGTSDGATII